MGKHGRLGNQMFQYATLYSVAKKNNYEFGIPFKQKSESSYFNLQIDECFPNLSAKDSSNIESKNTYLETSFKYDDSIFSIEDNTNICGNFQSEKYFKNYKQDIKQEFEFCDRVLEQTQSILSKFMEPPIALHIRMGDYKISGGKHPICNIDYYKNALQEVPDSSPLFVFSDEPNSVKEHLKNLNRSYKIYTDTTAEQDLCLMVHCDYHIIANSSFSWWGAWLSNSKKVIAPYQWFGDRSFDWSYIYCENWSVI